MFDFGWQEFLVIAFVLVLVVGPKDLPKVLKTVTKYIRNMRQMASEFHRGIEKMADETDLKDSFNELKNNNIDKIIIVTALHYGNSDLPNKLYRNREI